MSNALPRGIKLSGLAVALGGVAALVVLAIIWSHTQSPRFEQAGPQVVFHATNGDLMQARLASSRLQLATPYGELDLATSSIRMIKFQSVPPGTVEVWLDSEQGRVSGTLASTELTLLSLDGGEMTVPVERIRSLVMGDSQQHTASLMATNTLTASATTMSFRDRLSDGGEGPEMLLIPNGQATIGAPEDEANRRDNESQQTIGVERPLAIGRYEVTFAEYDRFAEATGREMPYDQDWGRGQRPVINISWHDAYAFTRWLSEETGRSYRLPTESEWEYAARAGTTTAFWWGQEIAPGMANCKDCGAAASVTDQERATREVGSLAANPFGLFDVAGNVWEWTCSRYKKIYDGQESICAEAEDEELRAIRGGSYLNQAQRVRSAARDSFSPADRNELVGFRLAREL